MKTILLFIMALAFSFNVMAEKSVGQVEGCGGDELEGCKCITDTIAEKEVTGGSGDVDSSGNQSDSVTQ